MEEENKNVNSDVGMSESGMLGGKFKSVDALLHAYGELEAEFTRRSQRLKALEEGLASAKDQAARGDEPRRASTESCRETETQRQSDPLSENGSAISPQAPIFAQQNMPVRGVPLMGAGGAGVVAPKLRPSSIAEAGSLALGYFKRQKP